MNATFHPFADAFIEEIKQLHLWVNFTIFDPRKILKAKEELKTYGNEELVSNKQSTICKNCQFEQQTKSNLQNFVSLHPL